MHPILEKIKLSDAVYLLKISAKHIAFAKPGQFVMIQPTELSEPIPLSVLESFDGGFTCLVKVVGRTSLEIVEEAQELYYVAGPLGKPFPIEDYGKVVFYTYSWGMAPALMIAKALKERGNSITLQHTSEDFYLREEAQRVFDEVIHDKVLKVFEADLVVSVGSNSLSKSLVLLYPNTPIKSMVNVHMLDAVGLCLVCRVRLGDRYVLACCDGPWFDAHKVDWNNLIEREGTYQEQERVAFEEYKKILKRKELKGNG
ncbi:MAG: oxidoreductase [Aquificaceae bacterium]